LGIFIEIGVKVIRAEENLKEKTSSFLQSGSSSRLETAADWSMPFQKGIAYYFREGRASGVLLWNVWDKDRPFGKRPPLDPQARIFSTWTSIC
jgi:hypothetical protein